MTSIALIALLALFAAPARALDPKDMTAWETERWAQVKSDKKDAASFQTTRDYFRLCRRIVDGKAPAKGLPGLPKGFDKKHLAKGESKVINQAVQLSVNAFIDEKAEKDPAYGKNLPAMIDAVDKAKSKPAR